MKVCKKCRKQKELKAFTLDKGCYRRICKECNWLLLEKRIGKKFCKTCQKEKLYSEFYHDAARHEPNCIICALDKQRKRYQKSEIKKAHSEYGKQYYLTHKQDIHERKKSWRIRRVEVYREQQRRREPKNKILQKKYSKAHRENLSDQYIKNRLYADGIKNPPQEFIDIKRINLKIKREIRSQTADDSRLH